MVVDRPTLNNEEIKRYSRHLILPEVGLEGQRRLKGAKVLIVGVGGLGSPLGLYLSAAGIGTLGLVDFDAVDFSNLQRQILHSTQDVGRSKLDSAVDRIASMNPNVNLIPYKIRLTSDNALELFKDYDVIVDGTDNFATRYLVNDACVLLGKPNVYGSVFRFEGQASVFWAENGPCYRCVYEKPPPPGLVPSCAEGGVLGILPGLVGIIQTTEIVKLVLGIGTTLVGRLMLIDALEMKFQEIDLHKNPNCVICGENPVQTSLIDYEGFCGIEENPHAKLDSEKFEITVDQAQEQLNSSRPPFLLDVRTPQEWEIVRLEGATLIPLSELGTRWNEIPRNKQVIIYCHKGVRSMKALNLLRAVGLADVRSMAGGVDVWVERIAPGRPRY